jgi:hypothetical protein
MYNDRRYDHDNEIDFFCEASEGLRHSGHPGIQNRRCKAHVNYPHYRVHKSRPFSNPHFFHVGLDLCVTRLLLNLDTDTVVATCSKSPSRKDYRQA